MRSKLPCISISVMEPNDPLNSTGGETNILLISTILFGVVAFVFGVLAIYSVISAQNARTSLNTAKTASYKDGQDAQKQQGSKDALAAAEAPYRSYKAATEFGNFEIKFPKNWSAYVVEDLNATNQVSLSLHPDLIRQAVGKDNNYAFRALLVKSAMTGLQKTYDDRVKSKKLTTKTVTVSGISGLWYEGQFDDKHNGVIVLVPVRDKTLEFITDYSKDYISEFNEILAQAVVPS